MADIGAVTPSIYNDGAAFGVLAELTQQPRSRPSLRCRFGEQDDGSVHADRQYVIIRSKRLEDRPVFYVGAETADAGNDCLACLGMPPELARQGEQPQRGVEVDIHRLYRSRQSDALRFELTLVCAELAELEPEPASAADRAKARIAPRAVIREKMPPELGIERGQHLANGQLLGAVDRGRKVPPEIAQHFLPCGATARHVVELVLEIGGERVFDVALEKAGQKRGDEPPTVFWQETALLNPDVRTILQDLQDRRISRRAADAELFELLDEARLGVARRRLREMLSRFDRAACEPLALAHRRQSGRFAFLLGSIVAVLLVECQKPVKNDDRTGRP